MLIRTMDQLEAEGRIISISHGKASAVRLLTKSDGVGFSVSEARADGGRSSDLWYKNHWEANFVRSGHGVLEDRSTGEQWPLSPGVLYCVGPTDRHRVTRDENESMRIISVFNPPHRGRGDPRRGRRLSAHRRDPAGSAAHVREDDRGCKKGRTRARPRGRRGHQHPVPARRRQPGILTPRGTGGRGDRARSLVQEPHWEANLILDGTLAVTDYASGDIHRLGPGGLYLVGPTDRHRIEAVDDVHLISVFNPPLTGTETHDEDGAYPPTGPIPPGPSPQG